MLQALRLNNRESLKKVIRPFYKFKLTRYVMIFFINVFWCNRWVRRFLTHNFSTGCLAVGEQNKYCVSSSWITLDIDGADFNYDIRKKHPFPFASESISLIYSSHMVEHIDNETTRFFFCEANRMLKPNGILRIEAPDTEKIVQAYLRKDELFFTDMLSKKEKRQYGHNFELHDIFVGLLSCYIVNNKHVHVSIPKHLVDEKVKQLSPEAFANWCVSYQTDAQKNSGGHIHPITKHTLSTLLQEAGFKVVKEVKSGESSHALMKQKLKGIERGHRGYFSIILEAQKS